MSSEPTSPSSSPLQLANTTPPLTDEQTKALLQTLLDAAAGRQRRRGLEIACAFMLALSTMASAWCAYQSTLWDGVQTFRIAGANRAGREATQFSIEATQLRAFDAQMVIAYIEARSRGDEQSAEFLHQRFRPEARKAFDAWMATDPFHSTGNPQRLFALAEYVQPELQEAERRHTESSAHMAIAHRANRASDTYVLLTVLFASVLFFGGICGTFQSERLRLIVFSIAVTLFAGTLIVVATLPICAE